MTSGGRHKKLNHHINISYKQEKKKRRFASFCFTFSRKYTHSSMYINFIRHECFQTPLSIPQHTKLMYTQKQQLYRRRIPNIRIRKRRKNETTITLAQQQSSCKHPGMKKTTLEKLLVAQCKRDAVFKGFFANAAVLWYRQNFKFFASAFSSGRATHFIHVTEKKYDSPCLNRHTQNFSTNYNLSNNVYLFPLYPLFDSTLFNTYLFSTAATSAILIFVCFKKLV